VDHSFDPPPINGTRKPAKYSRMPEILRLKTSANCVTFYQFAFCNLPFAFCWLSFHSSLERGSSRYVRFGFLGLDSVYFVSMIHQLNLVPILTVDGKLHAQWRSP
jgi:hypothetical protein